MRLSQKSHYVCQYFNTHVCYIEGEEGTGRWDDMPGHCYSSDIDPMTLRTMFECAKCILSPGTKIRMIKRTTTETQVTP